MASLKKIVDQAETNHNDEDIEQIPGFVAVDGEEGDLVEYIPEAVEYNFSNDEDILKYAYSTAAKIGFSLEDFEEDYILEEITNLKDKKLDNTETEKEIANRIAVIVLDYYGEWIDSKLSKDNLQIITESFISEYFITNYKDGKQLGIKFLSNKLKKSIQDLLVSSVKISENSFELTDVTPKFADLILKNAK